MGGLAQRKGLRNVGFYAHCTLGGKKPDPVCSLTSRIMLRQKELVSQHLEEGRKMSMVFISQRLEFLFPNKKKLR